MADAENSRKDLLAPFFSGLGGGIASAMRIERILVVDDEDDVRRVVTELLRGQGYTVLGMSSLHQAADIVQKEPFDLVICDLVFKEGNGLEFLKNVKTLSPKTQTILMTGYASMETAVEAVRMGLFDYLIKPINPADLVLTLRRLESFEQLQAENNYLRSGPDNEDDILWGNSPVMREISELVEKVGQTQATVLIQGESGTGKEVVARALYQHSPRVAFPFIKLNCAAVPEALLESEFFGHERGAFTGATSKREGRFETAHNGTLLLDEISEISPSLQVKLLRVLQEREFERVGGNKTIRVDVRIIATTNRNLMEEVKAGRFREDLYYRLNVVPIHLPPLRERQDDMDRLVEHFMAKFMRKHGKSGLTLSVEARERLRGYTWPGNVRELQNMIERAVILGRDGQILEEEDLVLIKVQAPASGRMRWAGALPKVEDMERRLIGMVLVETGNNKTRAANKLGISLRTLRNKLNLYRRQGFDVAQPHRLAEE
jgi:DNA-binding NtrC family response regulator